MLGPPCPHHPRPEHTGNGPWLPAPRDRRLGEGQRLTPDDPHNGGRPAPRDGLPPPARHAAPRRACKPKGQCRACMPAHPRPQQVGSGPRQPAPLDGQPGEDERLTSHAPHNSARHPPRGRPPADPTARNAGSQERTLWGRCCVPHAHATRAWNTRAAGPGCLPTGTSGRGRDSA